MKAISSKKEILEDGRISSVNNVKAAQYFNGGANEGDPEA
jgi:hypothetical protein